MTDTPEFAIALRGYDREQVDAYAAQVQRLLEEADVRVREGELPAPRGENADERLGGRLAAILKLAEEEAGVRRAAAQRDATAILDRARSEADRIRAAAAGEVEHVRASAANAQRDANLVVDEGRRVAEELLVSARRHAESQADAIVAEAEAEVRRMLDDAEQRRREQETATTAAERRYDDIQEAMSRLRATLVPEVTDIRQARGAA